MVRISTLIFIFFSYSVLFSQYVELTGTQDLGPDLALAKDGSFFSLKGLSLAYWPSFDCTADKVISKKYADFSFEQVKWDAKQSRFEVISCSVKGGNLFCRGYVADAKTQKVHLMEYVIDKQLNLVSERIVQLMDQPIQNLPVAVYNSDSSFLMIIDFTYKLIDKKKEIYSQRVDYLAFDQEFSLIYKGSYELENAQKIEGQYLDMSGIKYRATHSALILDNGTLLLNIGGQLYAGALNDEHLDKWEIDSQYEITSYEIHEGKEGNICLVGGYSKGLDCGIAALYFDKDLIQKSSHYIPASPSFIKGFYQLSYDFHKTPAKERKEKRPFNHLKPILIKSHMEEDGTIRLAYVGIAYGERSFRNNLLLAAVKDGEVLYQEVIPYLYNEDAYSSVGDSKSYVYFGNGSTTVVFHNYTQNYKNTEFVPAAEKFPLSVKPLYAVVTYDYADETLSHKLLEVRVSNGITYKAKASYIFPSYQLLPNGDYVISCDEWGATSLKASYTGRLVLEN